MSSGRKGNNGSRNAGQLPLHLQDPAGVEPVLSLQDPRAALSLLEEWLNAGWLQPLDVGFARFLYESRRDVSGLLLLAAALTSHQLGRGHVCLDLNATLRSTQSVLDLPPEFAAEPGAAPTLTPAQALGQLALEDWRAALNPAIVSDGSVPAPLVQAGNRLYLYRYWRYEQQVAAAIAARVQSPVADEHLPVGRVRAAIDALFGPVAKHGGADWQRLACALAARSRFAVVTGGPGTGKTTTVVRLLALLQALHHEARSPGEPWRPLRIRLAAPTGKAAARLNESIAGKVHQLPYDNLAGGSALAASIPVEVVTLHSLLGGRPHSQARRFHAGNPLPLDVLVIDEASMVPLAVMADVVAALRPDARLILIGDKDQLASVEAGAVLGEICRRAQRGHYRLEVAQWLEQATGTDVPQDLVDPDGTSLDQAVAMLRYSHRFGSHSGIGRLAAAVNEGRVEDALAQFEVSCADLALLRLRTGRSAPLAKLIVEGIEAPAEAGVTATDAPERRGYGHYLARVAQVPDSNDLQAFDQWAIQVLEAHRSCQVLCVVREGPWGVKGLNDYIARELHRKGLVPAHAGWYVGRPVMITRNNRALRLINGDIGVVLPYPLPDGEERALRVAFSDGAGGVRWFAPNRLDDVETVYALTVHKSQGSEFDHAVLVMPATPTPVLTRELVYTGITRASRGFTLVLPGTTDIFAQAIAQRVYRSGGLGDALDTLR